MVQVEIRRSKLSKIKQLPTVEPTDDWKEKQGYYAGRDPKKKQSRYKARVSEFSLDSAYHKGWLAKPGVYSEEERYSAALTLLKAYDKASIGGGNGLSYEYVASSPTSKDSLSFIQIASLHIVVNISRRMNEEHYDLMYQLIKYGKTLGEALPHVKKNGGKSELLCKALDDLCNTLREMNVKF